MRVCMCVYMRERYEKERAMWLQHEEKKKRERNQKLQKKKKKF